MTDKPKPSSSRRDFLKTTGTIVAASQDGLHVACAPGVLAITQVKPEGRRPMPVRDFVNGAGPLVGTVLT